MKEKSCCDIRFEVSEVQKSCLIKVMGVYIHSRFGDKLLSKVAQLDWQIWNFLIHTSKIKKFVFKQGCRKLFYLIIFFLNLKCKEILSVHKKSDANQKFGTKCLKKERDIYIHTYKILIIYINFVSITQNFSLS